MLSRIPWHRRLWHRWKALRNVPLRKTWFVGYDLDANSYWEFKDGNNAHRLRRRAFSARGDMHLGDFQPAPQWMQWLRFARPTPPTLQELVNDIERQKRLKVLASQADERWRSVPLRHEAARGDVDPRLDSAWSGQPATQTVYAQPASSSAQPAQAAHPASGQPASAQPAAPAAARVADVQKLINERDAQAKAAKAQKDKLQREADTAKQAAADATAKRAEAEAEKADPWAAADAAQERESAVLKPSKRG